MRIALLPILSAAAAAPCGTRADAWIKTSDTCRRAQGQPRLRIGRAGRYNDLINTPTPQACKGKDQILYRGLCVEG